VNLSHPRRAGDPGFAALRQALLQRLGVESLA
jgi:sulfonate transport system ATP-binding protein